MGAEMAPADGWTDMTKLILVFIFFCKFANALKNASFIHIHINFIQNFGIPIKMSRYVDVILELCRGRQKTAT